MRTTSLRLRLSLLLLAGAALQVAAAPAAAPAAVPAAPPAFAGLLSEANAKKARGLLSELDAARKGITARMEAARAALAKSEHESLVALAVARARPEAASALAPDSSYRGSEAARAALAAARGASLAAARALAEGSAFAEGKSVADLEKSAAAKAAELGKLLKGAGLGDKGTATVEKELLPRLVSFAELFPEAVDVGALLKKSGVEGKGLWLAALSRLDARSAAAFLVESRAEALKRAPAAAAALDRLAAVLEAEALWRRAAPIALHAAAGDPESRLAASAAAFAALGEERAAALLAAAERGPWRLGGLGKGTSLPAGGEGPARRLARLAAALPEPRRRSLAAGLGFSKAEFLAFLLLLERSSSAPPNAPGAPVEAMELETAVLELNRLRSLLASPRPGLADPGSAHPAAGAVSLALLAKPGLLELAASDARYAELFSVAGSRLGALFADAEKRFLALLAADKAFGQALASQVKDATFSIALLEAAVPDGSRRFAVSVRAARKKEGAAAAELVLAPKASLAAPLYARAFAEAAGLESELKAAGPAAFLRKYRVEIVSAYPAGKEPSILPLERFPPVDDPGLALSLSFAELEADYLAGGLR